MDSNPAGRISSAVHAPGTGRNMGILADIDIIANGRGLRVETPEDMREVELTTPPGIDASTAIDNHAHYRRLCKILLKLSRRKLAVARF